MVVMPDVATWPGARVLDTETISLQDIISVATLGQPWATATVEVLGGRVLRLTAPVPLSIFFSAVRTTAEEAMAYAIELGVTSIALDQPYEFTGTVTIPTQNFQIWGYSNEIDKQFDGHLFHYTSASRFSLTRDLKVLANGHTGNILHDEGQGDCWHENVHCLDVASGSRVYLEAAIGAFNRGHLWGGNMGSDDPESAAVMFYDNEDAERIVTGNGKIFGSQSSNGILLDCGSSRELKVEAITSKMPYLNNSTKTHFTDCRLTSRTSSPSLITIGDSGSSSLCTLTACSFGTPVLIRAPNVRIVGCRFNDLTLDSKTAILSGVDLNGDLVYGPGWSGAALRPNAVVQLSNAASVTLPAAEGDYFTLSVNQDPTIEAPGSPSPGQIIYIAMTARNADRTLTLATGAGGFSLGGISITPTVADTTDTIVAQYSQASDRWNVILIAKGGSAGDPGPNYFNNGAFLSQAGGGGSIFVPLPSPLVVGAVLIMSVGSKNNQTHGTPAGWTKVDQVDAGASWTVSLYRKIADGTETDPEVTIAGAQPMSGIILQYNGNNATPFGDIEDDFGTLTTARTVSEVTTTANNSKVVYIVHSSAGGANDMSAPPSPWTERNEFFGSPASQFTFGDRYVASSGSASGTLNLTASTSANYVAHQIEIVSA